jgi:sigma-B regulation protein RsbU (phosphoserine phosphatase)
MAKPTESKQRAPRLKDFKLNSLLDITKAINNNQPVSELLTVFEDIVRNKLAIGKLVLFSHDGLSWQRLLSFGDDAHFAKIVPERDFAGITEITTVDFSQQSLHRSFEIIIPVFHKSQALAYVLIGDLNEDENGMSAAIKHLPFVQTLTNIMIVAIENKKLFRENLKRAAMHRELELAWEVQRMLFPEKLPHNEYLDMDALYLPHQSVGGDYYDFIQLNENEVAFCVADVSGKGVPAALLMSNFQASLQILLRHTTDLSALVHELNAKVIRNSKGEKFITLFIAKYNTVTHVMNYINAGHNPPLIVDAEGTNLLTVGCTGLGMFDELERVREGIVNIQPGALLICYTDGLVEQSNEADEEYGMERVQELVKVNRMKTPIEINQLLLQGVNAHKGDKAYVDDIALITVRIK